MVEITHDGPVIVESGRNVKRIPGRIQTYTGGSFFPLNPRPQDVNITDIAWALSRKCRFGCHPKQFYSVGQHSVIVSNTVPDHVALYGLLHDAGEAYLPDVPSPIKDAFPAIRDLEETMIRVIFEGLKIEWPSDSSWDAVNAVDSLIVFNEMDAIMEWSSEGQRLAINRIVPVGQLQAFDMFMQAYEHLRKGCGC